MGATTKNEQKRIVVGVDGSKASMQALEHAIDLARASGARVEVITVYDPPTYSEDPGRARGAMSAIVAAGALAPPPNPEAAQAMEMHARSREGARQEHQAMLRTMLRDTSPGEVEVDVEAVADTHPVRVLVDRSRDADGLVLGSRGLGGIAGMLLGSVTTGCVRHASCPVTVVPYERN